MSPTSPSNENSGNGSGRLHETARRDKLHKIAQMGIDPWGARFDNRDLIGDIRRRAGEVKFHIEAGALLDLPDPNADPELNFRQCGAAMGTGPRWGQPSFCQD
jgi:lysyl-tRNA synthetase class 2